MIWDSVPAGKIVQVPSWRSALSIEVAQKYNKKHSSTEDHFAGWDNGTRRKKKHTGQVSFE